MHNNAKYGGSFYFPYSSSLKKQRMMDARSLAHAFYGYHVFSLRAHFRGTRVVHAVWIHLSNATHDSKNKCLRSIGQKFRAREKSCELLRGMAWP